MKTTKWPQFLPLISVFFFWGFVAASNDILIPVFKSAFALTQAQSQWVSLAFYIAYTVGSVLYFLISLALKKDLVNTIGYKNALAAGLCISAAGCTIFYPAANLGSYALMLTALFTVGFGFSLQQTVANPLAILLGTKETGSQRLTMAGGINNLGTTIGPLIVSYAIFGNVSADAAPSINLENVKIPFLILGAAFLLVAIILKLSPIEEHPDTAKPPEVKAEVLNPFGALRDPRLVLGMLGIFIYVGVEVSTVSNLPEYLKTHLGFEESKIAPFVTLYWASLMMGRWAGSVDGFSLPRTQRIVFKFLMPYLAFGVFLLVNIIAEHPISSFYPYAAIIPVLIFFDLLSGGKPERMLLLFSAAGILCLLTGMFTTGLVSVYSFTAVGLFCSTLWPCIFAIAIRDLGKYTSQGSSFLIMMIMGGGIISWLQGKLSATTGIQMSYITGIICFGYLIFYAAFAMMKDKNTPQSAKEAL